MSTTAVYDQIAEHFSATRYKPWRGVKAFLEAQPAGSTMLEVGCGNGKNLGVRAADCVVHGCDPCAPLLAHAQGLQPHAQLVVADGRALPYSDSSMDVVLSIAVLHHLETHADRRRFLQEFVRVWNGKAAGLITVWATEAVKPTWQPGPAPGDYWVPWTQANGSILQRYYHVFTREELLTLFRGIVPVKKVVFECDNWYVYV
jgi:ubiquinone/menaquinone biosynthesis C-methylase UbiE